MSTRPVSFPLGCALALGFLLGFSPWVRAETVTVARQLVRFDGRPAAGARVRVMGDYGGGYDNTDFEVVAGTNGVFSTDLEQDKSLWVGHLLIRADGCAPLCEVEVTGRRKQDPSWTPERRLGAAYNIGGRTTDAAGRPVAGATVSLVWAQLQSWNATPFNSTTTHPIATPELIAHSDSNGSWSMPGLDFILQENDAPFTAVFEAVADNPLRTARASLKLEPDHAALTRKDVPLDISLAPPIRVTGRVVNSVTGAPVAGVSCTRSVIFTVLAGTSAVTDAAGRFALDIPGPLPNLWFQLYDDGYASVTPKTAMLDAAASDWTDSQNLRIAVRPLVDVSGTLLDENGKILDERVQLAANYQEKINATWNLECKGEGKKTEVGADGSFHAKLPAGLISVVLTAQPDRAQSGFGGGRPPPHYRLQQDVDIPGAGMTGLQLHAARTGDSK